MPESATLKFNSKPTKIVQNGQCRHDVGGFGAQLIPLLVLTLLDRLMITAHDKMGINNKTTVSFC